MSLSFLGAAFAGALALCAIPLIIHLISKRRPRPVQFAAIEFLLANHKKVARRVQLKQILLLLLRTLMVFAIVAAFLQPVLTPRINQTIKGQPRIVFFVLDVSASMKARVGAKTSFLSAIDDAKDALFNTSKDIQVGLLACGLQTNPVLLKPTFAHDEIKEALNDLKLGHGTADIMGCIEQTHTHTETGAHHAPYAVYVFSDMAKHSFLQREFGSNPRLAEIKWFPSHSEPAPRNAGIHPTGIQHHTRNRTSLIEFHYTAFLPEKQETDLSVELQMGDDIISRQTVIPEDRNASRYFSMSIDDVRQRSGSVDTLNGVPASVTTLAIEEDALSSDNRVHYPVVFPPTLNILVINGDPQPIPFRDEIFYLENALEKEKPSWATIRLSSITDGQIADGALAEADVVILANVATLMATSVTALHQFVKAGGGLLVTMGDQVDPAWMNQNFSQLLPGRLRGDKSRKRLEHQTKKTNVTFGQINRTHPMFKQLLDPEGQTLIGLSQVKTHKSMLLEPDGKAPRSVLIAFSDGTPALVERRIDQGNVLFWATSIDRDWSDLSIRPGFVPFVNYLMLYLGGISQQPDNPFLVSGQVRRIELPKESLKATIVFPDDTRQIFMKDDFLMVTPDGIKTEVPFLQIHGDLPYGLYHVEVAEHESEPYELMTQRFVVVPPPEESDLTPIDETSLQTLLPKGVQGSTIGSASASDVKIWPWFLVLTALLIAAEGLLLHMSRRRSHQSPPF